MPATFTTMPFLIQDDNSNSPNSNLFNQNHISPNYSNNNNIIRRDVRDWDIRMGRNIAMNNRNVIVNGQNHPSLPLPTTVSSSVLPALGSPPSSVSSSSLFHQSHRINFPSSQPFCSSSSSLSSSSSSSYPSSFSTNGGGGGFNKNSQRSIASFFTSSSSSSSKNKRAASNVHQNYERHNSKKSKSSPSSASSLSSSSSFNGNSSNNNNNNVGSGVLDDPDSLCPICFTPLSHLDLKLQESHQKACLESFDAGETTVSKGKNYVVRKNTVDDAGECPICFEDFEVGDEIALMDCFCKYHIWCKFLYILVFLICLNSFFQYNRYSSVV
jgi:hypothetical protein